MARVLIALIRIYQLTLSRVILALLGPVCRFTPSCSAYALECVRLHGAARGSLLSVRRLTKCHPFHPGGYDPPPPPKASGITTNPGDTAGTPRTPGPGSSGQATDLGAG
jgi:uncharacterized protein